MKRATAYQRGERIILHASSKTKAGVWILSAPVLAADQTDPRHLGEGVLEALDGSREGVPHPISWKGIFDPVLQLAGVKSWGTFAKMAKCVQIEFGTNRIALLPTKNLGAKDGFEPLPAKLRSSSPVTADIGNALLFAFRDAE
jgi:hypothetical protein